VPPGHSVSLHSFDKTLKPLEFALQNAEALEYPLGFEPLLRELISRGRVAVAPGFVWELHLGDFSGDLISTAPVLLAPDAIFYDPYSPIGNPEMWTLDAFTRLYSRLDP